MTCFPRLDQDWRNPFWQPKFFGGKRMPRKLKKQFNYYQFWWFRKLRSLIVGCQVLMEINRPGKKLR